MRLASLFALALLALPAACTSSNDAASDGGMDTYIPLSNDADDEFEFDVPTIGDAGTVSQCTLSKDADPVGLCVQKQALSSLHAQAFAPSKGAAASWSSNPDGGPDKDDAGVVPYTLDDTVAYGAAIAGYLSSAELYGDTSIDAPLQADLQSIALLLETSFAPPPTEYSGELYFHLRSLADGLELAGMSEDAPKINALADAYGRSILTAHYVALAAGAVADAGKGADAGKQSDGGGVDGARPDATSSPDAKPVEAGAPGPDGIIGNPADGDQIAYSTGDVATAIYALLDLVARYPKDTSVPSWLNAARASLDHLEAHAVEKTTGMLYTALLTPKGGGAVGPDALAPATGPYPNDALLADTQATFAYAMVRAQYVVTSNTEANLTGGDADPGGTPPPVTDAGVFSPFLPILDIPFEARARQAIQAMNGTHSLWDEGVAAAGDAGDAGDAAVVGHGYMDGYIPSTRVLITTKSTRPNALMAGAFARALVNKDGTLQGQLVSLVNLLVSQFSATTPLNSNFITVLPAQLAYLRGATRSFSPLDSGPNPTSYTTCAVSAAIDGLTEQLFAQTMM